MPAPALAELRARAFTWLGNAHRLACDFRAAESAFSAAGAVLALLDPEQAPIGRAEYLDRKAALRWLESRYDQAHELATQAPPFSSACSPDQQARMALQRAEIEAAKGDLRASCATLEAVSKRLVMVEDRHLSSVAWLNLTFRYIELGDLEPAQRAARARAPCPRRLAIARSQGKPTGPRNAGATGSSHHLGSRAAGAGQQVPPISQNEGGTTDHNGSRTASCGPWTSGPGPRPANGDDAPCVG